MNAPACLQWFLAGVVTLSMLLAVGANSAVGQTQRVVPSDRVVTFVNVRETPDVTGTELGRLLVGESAEVISSVPRWYQVRLASGAIGYVSKSWVSVTQTLGPRRTDELRIHHLNVGTGACAIVECPGAGALPMIVDCGSIGRGEEDLAPQDVSKYLSDVLSAHTDPPNIVLSHGDRDHYSLIPQVLGTITATNIWMGGKTADYTSDAFPVWLEAQRDAGATIHDESSMPANWHNNGQPIGESLNCGLAEAFVLTVNTGEDKNTQSLLLLLEYKDFSAIFSGDAEGLTEQQAITNFDNNVKATVVTGSHHGARTKGSNSAIWASATAPAVMIYSAGEKFSHPTCTAVERFSTVVGTTEHAARCGLGGEGNYRIYRTKRAEYMTRSVGTVIVTSNGTSPMTVNCTKSKECGVRIPH